jgi:hypothetical protein
MLGVALCALLFAAPCAAAEGAWFLNERLVAEPSTFAPSAGDEERVVVLAHGVVSRSLVRPKPPNPDVVPSLVLGAGGRASECAIIPTDDDLSPRPADPGGRETLLRICVLLI